MTHACPPATVTNTRCVIFNASLSPPPHTHTLEEEAALAPESNALAPDNLPPQLLFVHSGQTDMKEMHWHPQVCLNRGGWVGG